MHPKKEHIHLPNQVQTSLAIGASWAQPEVCYFSKTILHISPGVPGILAWLMDHSWPCLPILCLLVPTGTQEFPLIFPFASAPAGRCQGTDPQTVTCSGTDTWHPGALKVVS